MSEALRELDALRAMPIGKVLGMNTNPEGLAYECQNCIGSCCLGPIMDANVNEIAALAEGGTLLIKNGSNVQDILKPADNPCNPLIRPGSINLLNPSELHTVRIVGACGNRMECGGCSIHESANYPEPCRDTEMGGYECKMKFVAIGSEAAKEVQRRIDNASKLSIKF